MRWAGGGADPVHPVSLLGGGADPSNDAIVPLHETYAGCEEDADGLCALEHVVAALQTRVAEIDYNKACSELVGGRYQLTADGPIFNITETSQLKDSNGMPYQ